MKTADLINSLAADPIAPPTKMLVIYSALSRLRLAACSAKISRCPSTIFICTAKSSATPVTTRLAIPHAG